MGKGVVSVGFIKLCGMVTSEDVRAAASAGADAIGLVVDFPKSPRSVDVERASALARESDLPVVALLVEPDELKLRSVIDRVDPWAVQLSGHEAVEQVRALKDAAASVELWKVLHLPAGRPGNDEPWSSPVSMSSRHSPADTDGFLELAAGYHEAGIDRIVLDARHDSLPGGTGLCLDWSGIVDLIDGMQLPIVLAGGLTPENVSEAIELSGVAAVDVSSGIESAPGVKDPALMHLFVRNAREAFAG